MRKIIAVDFDGTCVTREWPAVGRDIGAESVLHELVANGWDLILWTTRSGKELQDAIDWFERKRIPLWDVNRNPEPFTPPGGAVYGHGPKVYAQIYIDDAALGCPLVQEEGKRPYVDWVWVRELLVERGAL